MKTSLQSGTKSTAKNDLQSQDICSIIDTCAKNKVTALKYGGLEISFLAETVIPKTVLSNPPDNDISEEQHVQNNTESFLKEEVMTREEQLALLLIEDPVRYEQMLEDGELEEDAADESE